MVRIVDQSRFAVQEYALRFVKGNAVLGEVAARFPSIPRE